MDFSAVDSAPADASQLEHDFSPFLRTYKDGRVERLMGTSKVPPSPSDPITGVSSKDVPIPPTPLLSARLYFPSDISPGKKLPVLVYYHGGGFCIESAASPTYHNYLNSVASHTGVLVVSVDYRLAPENPLPAAYHDSWAALQWVASRSDPWLDEHADLNHVFIAGDSAGANICHWLALRAGVGELPGGVEIEGVVLVHCYFWGSEPVGSEPKDPKFRESFGMNWLFICPSSTRGVDDPWLNPVAEGAPNLKEMGCKKVLICVAEQDLFKERSLLYHEKLKESGWPGKVELLVSHGENHVFHLFKPTCENAVEKMERLASFFNAA